MTWIDPDNDVADLMVIPVYACLNIEADPNLAAAHPTGFLDVEIIDGHFVHQVEADAIPGAAWNDPDNDVKGSNEYPQDEVPQYSSSSQIEHSL